MTCAGRRATVVGMTQPHLTRRGVLGAAALAFGITGVTTLTGTVPTLAAADEPLRPVLPRPTGPYPIGTVSLHLAGHQPGRDLMASVWYPARDCGRFPPTLWMPPAVLRELLSAEGFPPDAGLPPWTSAHEGAPVRRGRDERLPVILYSHGAHDHRAGNTIVVQELASHGYLVVTVDHTWDAFSQFPDGRIIVPINDGEHGLGPADFSADILYVLSQVEHLAAGRSPDVDRRPLPAGLAGAPDLGRIGAFGWSKGGTATALTMLADRRVRAGLSFDAPMQPDITADLDRPFLLVTAENTRAAAPSVAGFWSHLHGWRRNIQADGAAHNSYTDYQILVPQFTGEVLPLDPARATRIQQAYPLAFFDRHLRHRGHLLDGPSPAFPEVRFIP